MALEGHAEALSADIERLYTKLEVPNNSIEKDVHLHQLWAARSIM